MITAAPNGNGYAVQTQPVPVTRGRSVFVFNDPDFGFNSGNFGPLKIQWPDGPPLVNPTGVSRDQGRAQQLSYSGSLTANEGRLAWCPHGTFGIRDADLQEAIRQGRQTAPCVVVTVG